MIHIYGIFLSKRGKERMPVYVCSQSVVRDNAICLRKERLSVFTHKQSQRVVISKWRNN